MTRKDTLAALQAKKGEFDAILAKGDQMTADDVTKAEGLRDETRALKGKLDEFARADEMAKSSAELADYLAAPARTVPFAVTGSEAAGECFISVDKKNRGRLDLEDRGPGVFGKKKWEAVATRAYHGSFEKYLRGEFDSIGRVERKAFEEGLDPQGGYLAPPDILQRIISRMAAPTSVDGYVTNLTTSRDALSIPKNAYVDSNNQYSTGFRITNTGENPSSATVMRVTDTNLFGSVRVPVYTYMLSGVLTNDQLEDSAFDVLTWVADKFRETISLHSENMIFNGTGVNEPLGILANLNDANQPVMVTTSTSNAIVGDDLWETALDVPPQYEQNLRWFLHKKNSFKTIRKLKDSQNRYIFGLGYNDSGLANGNPPNLCDYPYSFSQFLPTIATGNAPIAFGDFSGFYKVNRVGLSIQIMRDSRYAEANQVGILGRIRWGGMTVEPWKLRVLKIQ